MPEPGATGPSVANCAGASGPMQIGVGSGPCGGAGDAYDSLRPHLSCTAAGASAGASARDGALWERAQKDS